MFQDLIKNGQKLLVKMEIKERAYQWSEDLRNLNKMITFVWPRRVGKTYLMLNFVKKLIVQGKITLEQVVFLDFSFQAWQKVDPLQLISDYFELNPNQPPLFVLDEIQDVANMRELVLYLYNQQYKIFMSGSNANLLSSELSTHFRGRVFEYKVYPLIHKEILDFAWIPFQTHYATEDLAKIRHLYHTIFTYGSFPEILLAKDEFSQKEVVKWYFNVLFFRDIMERFRIDNEFAMRYLIKNLTLGFTKMVNIHKVFNSLKSQNIKLSVTTLYEYYDHIKSAFYGYELENFYAVLRSKKKIYLYNVGFHSLFSPSPDLGQSFENIIFLELKKKFDRIFFKINEKNKNAESNGGEIDFYIEARDASPFKGDISIQVCYHLTKKDFEREITPLLPLEGERYIISFHKDADIPDEQNGVKMIDFVDFLQKFDELG